MTLSDAAVLCFSTNYTNFGENVLKVFRFQEKNNPVYGEYLRLLGTDTAQISRWEQVPFLPVAFFKNHDIQSFEGDAGKVFLSSSTTGTGQSRHAVKYPELYEQSYLQGFDLFYGDPGEYTVLGLLPAYLEREDSSLVYMVADLIARSDDRDSGFFLYEHGKLHDIITAKIRENRKVLLIGVSFALLDFADKYTFAPGHLTVMETGGMKGRRKELTRQELHAALTAKLGVTTIHSEYGMTELLSQAYSKGNGLFACPPWMKVVIKPADDPLGPNLTGKRGRICVIDLANVFSCSFIETEDVGIAYADGTFEVLGRLDFSETRGCNVMVSD